MARSYPCLLAGAGGVALLMGCLPPSGKHPPLPPHAVVTRQDSVGEAWRLVYAYVRAVDDYARPRGELPGTLQPVVERGEAGPDTDPWGRHVRYRPDGMRFEVRSGGSDGRFDTNDDIVALGQLGRNQPCEIRTEFRVWTGVGFEPPCATNSPILVLPKCPQLVSVQRDREVPSTEWDSVLVMGRRLIRIARAVDGAGRDLGGLPLSLQPVPSFSRLPTQEIGDIWRRAVRYRPQGRDFEVRSAGVDGTFDTSDDIVVSGHLGRTLPCAFRTERGMVTCDDPPPPCPEGSGAQP